MPLYEFQPSFTVDQTDLTLTSTGSGVHFNKAVTVDLGILDRISGTVSSNAELLANNYVNSISVDILNINGSSEYTNFLTDYKSNIFTFTEYDNINVFGKYTKDFGVRFTLSESSETYTSEFYLYGNLPEFSGIQIQDSTGTTFHSSSESSKTAVNSTGQTGALTSVITFNNDIAYTAFNRVDVYSSSSSSEFASQINPNPIFSHNLTNEPTQSFDINEGSLPSNTPVYLHYVPYANLGSGAAWTVGPYTFEDNPTPTTAFLTTDQSGNFLQDIASVLAVGNSSEVLDFSSNKLVFNVYGSSEDASRNSVNSFASVILLGTKNKIFGDYDAIVGGTTNVISGDATNPSDFNFIGAGSGNDITGSNYASTIGGYNNDIFSSNYSVLGGGLNNLIQDDGASFIGGGASNKIQGGYASFIGGGGANKIYSEVSVIAGGDYNTITGDGYSFIGGGEGNNIYTQFGTILGGENNVVSGVYSTVSAGESNHIYGEYSFIAGGLGSRVSGDYASAIGTRIKIQDSHSGALVLADGQNRDHFSNSEHSATLDFANGVYINTGNLTVEESITMGGNTVLTGITSAEVIDALGYTPLSAESDDQTLDEVLAQGNTSSRDMQVETVTGFQFEATGEVGLYLTGPYAKIRSDGNIQLQTDDTDVRATFGDNYFYLKNNGANDVFRMVGGDAIIGSNTNPSKKLTVVSDGIGDGLQLETTSGNHYATLTNGNSETFPVGSFNMFWGSSNTFRAGANNNEGFVRGGSSAAGKLSLQCHTQTVATVRDGGIGIFYTDPNYELDVSGSGHFLNNLVVDGDLDVTGDITMGGNVVLTGITSGDITGALGYTPVNITDNSSNWNTAYTDRNKWDGGATGLNAATGRASLGLGTAATVDSSEFATAAQGTSAETAFGWGNHATGGYAATSHTHANATSVSAGFISSADFNKLSGIAASANNYSLPAGTSSERGGFKIGYSENGKNYPVEVSSEQMFVTVPWVDTIYTLTSGDITGALGFSPISTETDDQTLDEVLAQGNSSELGIDVGAITGSALTIDTNTLFVDSTNNRVGIGTTSPANKLDIRQSTSSGSDVIGTGAITIGSDNPYWTFRGTATSLQDLAFDRSYGGTWYESMRIQRSSGNVGIGTITPNEKLHVNGSVLATSFKKSGGSSGEFLKADGSVDSNSYLTSLGTAILDGDFTVTGLMKRTGVGTYASITDNSSDWNTAYGWGNHASGGYATLANPALTGIPTAPTPSAGTSSTQIATTAFVNSYFVSNRIQTPLQSFNPWGVNKMYDSISTNRFHGKSELLSLSIDGGSGAAPSSSLTDANYDGSAGTYGTVGGSNVVLEFDFFDNGLTNSNGFVYASGQFHIHFYPGRNPTAISARVKHKDGSYYAMTMTGYKEYTSGNYISWTGSCPIGNYAIAVEFTLTPQGSGGNTISLTQLEYHGSRMSVAEGGLLTKDGGIVYGNLGVTGNVGIGTTSPAASLHVYSESSTIPAFIGRLPFKTNANSQLRQRGGLIVDVAEGGASMSFGGIGSTSGGYIQAYQTNSTGTSRPLVLNPFGGFVGIGFGYLQSPTEALDVVGNIKASGTVEAASYTRGGVAQQDVSTGASPSFAGIIIPFPSVADFTDTFSGNVKKCQISSAGVALRSDKMIRWSVNTNSSTADSGIGRGSIPASVAIGNSAAGDASGTVQCANLTASGTVTATGVTATGTITVDAPAGLAAGYDLFSVNVNGTQKIKFEEYSGTTVATFQNLTFSQINTVDSQIKIVNSRISVGSSSALVFHTGSTGTAVVLGFSRVSDSIIGVGNGTVGNTTGSLSLANLTASGTVTAAGVYSLSTSGIESASPSNATLKVTRNDNINYSAMLNYYSGNSLKWAAGLSDAGAFTGSTGLEYQIGPSKNNPVFLISSSNNVGIGTTTPAEKLDVVGNILATSFKKSGGSSGEFLKADGSVDSNSYLTSLGTAILDGDFTVTGLMKRTGVGTYASITDNSSDWNTAYGWGNHASAGYATLASPALTGTPTAPTAAANTDTTQIATTAYVQAELADLIGIAPLTLDTLNELALALGEDANFSTTVTTALSNRLRVDINNQGLNSTQQGNGRTNLGLGTAATLSSSEFAAASHTHSISNVVGLQTALDGKSPTAGSTSLTTVGTIGTGTWQGTVIASAYLDADTAHLSGTQTFSGAKTFGDITSSGGYKANIAESSEADNITSNNIKYGYLNTAASNKPVSGNSHYASVGNITLTHYDAATNDDFYIRAKAYNGNSAWAKIFTDQNSSGITTVGTITSGEWNGSVIASAYLDADTAHLSGTQTFSGAKTFSAIATFSGSETNFASGSMLDWANGDARIIEGAHDNNYSLSFQTFDGSSCSTKMHILGNGNVGIGTNNPNNKLQVNYAPVAIASLTATSGTASTNWNRNAGLMITGASVSNALALGASGTANDRKAWIQVGHPDTAANSLGDLALNPLGGNVGIGTTSPSAVLHVEDTSLGYNQAVFKVVGSASAVVQIDGQGTVWSPKLNLTDTNQGIARKGGGQSRIWASSSIDIEDKLTNHLVRFDTVNLRVGIGTTNPSAKLEVAISENVNSYSDGAIQVVSSSPIAFVAPSNLNPSLNRWGFTLREGGEGHFGIRDYRHANTRVTIDDNGNVGIGTTTPCAKLEVNGHFAATTKSFIIPNPKKGGRLQYGVVETDEHSVYIRGKSNQNLVELPEEWEWLVDEDSVTVQLTSIGQIQQLFVTAQNNKYIKVCGLANNGEYNYVVYGTRKDVDPLQKNLK
jgi:hypothetical protein